MRHHQMPPMSNGPDDAEAANSNSNEASNNMHGAASDGGPEIELSVCDDSMDSSSIEDGDDV